jgi:adenosylcobinamide kinase/adenosylcobinamide-phosphate guanylyltransferase
MSYKKILFIGGQKSGKTAFALKQTLKLSNSSQLPFYVATYKNNFEDKSMQKRLLEHKKERKRLFKTIEKPKNINSIIKEKNTYIIDCLSMWIFNNIDKDESYFINHINKLLNKKANIVFVLNDVNSGIIPIDKLSRKFIDITGVVGKLVASKSNTVYSVKYGIKTKIK